MLFIDFSSAFNIIFPCTWLGSWACWAWTHPSATWSRTFWWGDPRQSGPGITPPAPHHTEHRGANITWSLNSSSTVKIAQQRHHFLRRLRRAHLPSPILTTFYRETIESLLVSCITTLFGNCTQTGPQEPAASGEDGWKDHRNHSPLHLRHLHHTLHNP